VPVALPAAVDAPVSPRDLLLRSWPGRIFLVSAVVKLLVSPFRGADAPVLADALGIASTIGLIFSVAYFIWRLVLLMKRRLLWRVRRKLILSYIFIGVVPAALIIGFFLVGASMIAMNVSAYMFKDGYDDVLGDVALMADAAANEIGRVPATARETVERVHRTGGQKYPGLSMAFVPAGKSAPPLVSVGRWEHAPIPTEAPAWLMGVGYTGAIAVPLRDSPGEADIVIRVFRPVARVGAPIGFVAADLPIDAEMLQYLYDKTGVRGGAPRVGAGAEAVPVVGLGDTGGDAGRFSLFRRSVTFFETRDWATGGYRDAAMSLTYRLGELYNRLSQAQPLRVAGVNLGRAVLTMLIVVAVLFLMIQCVALVMGLALARSITSSIHELFTGTERVRHGDFTHRIAIATRDQLGELADSFNQMTGSIEGLLQTAAEKKRLEEELRIARQIQMSLLPRGPLDVPGLGITALCIPAREVGGDYYDFFKLPGNRLGVLIADVSGKGTSAALYMAELKGLVLALSQTYMSPRDLLIAVNRIISEHLDARSFITMTYAVIDLERGLMTYCRAGHTPLIFMPGPAAAPPAAQVLIPSGMVLGLRIDGAAEKFADLLEEECIALNGGDVAVFYTDGISEAMNPASDLFGESRLSRLVEEHGHLESSELRERILREIEAFVGTADQHDDMTMILIKVEPAFAARVAV
jgi:sigma-B regulation protein RsbU (phosphoserine phosphatase)